ncbi:MAG: hypothetical protein ABWY27_15970 [Telluria sp.]
MADEFVQELAHAGNVQSRLLAAGGAEIAADNGIAVVAAAAVGKMWFQNAVPKRSRIAIVSDSIA